MRAESRAARGRGVGWKETFRRSAGGRRGRRTPLLFSASFPRTSDAAPTRIADVIADDPVVVRLILDDDSNLNLNLDCNEPQTRSTLSQAYE